MNNFLSIFLKLFSITSNRARALLFISVCSSIISSGVEITLLLLLATFLAFDNTSNLSSISHNSYLDNLIGFISSFFQYSTPYQVLFISVILFISLALIFRYCLINFITLTTSYAGIDISSRIFSNRLNLSYSKLLQLSPVTPHPYS